MLTGPSGSLTDDDDWVDGEQSQDEWPEVTVKNAADEDVTSTFVRDITGDAFTQAQIDAGWQKAFDPTTGIIRDGEEGEYRVRVEPTVAAGDYVMTVKYDVGGAPFPQTHTITLADAGFVDFLDGNFGVTADILTAGIVTSLTTPEVETLLTEAVRRVRSRIARHWMNPRDENLPDIDTLHGAVIDWGRALIFKRDMSAGEQSISEKEGDVTVRFMQDPVKFAETEIMNVKQDLDDYGTAWGPRNRPRVRTVRRCPP